MAQQDRSKPEIEGGVRIAWSAEGFEEIHVVAPRRTTRESDAYARGVADAALMNRTVADLRTALRREFPGEFDLLAVPHDVRGPKVIVRFHPPPGDPNPD